MATTLHSTDDEQGPGLRHVLALPQELTRQGIVLRAETADDRPFLEQLYVSVRWQELTPTAWSDEAKMAFLRSQFALQKHHYVTYYRDTECGILVHHGVPIGRLYLDRGPREYRVVDISLLPAWRGAGIGTAVLQAVCAAAAAADLPVTIHVEKFNPAQRLYRRLGFREIGENGPYYLMAWRASGVAD